MHNKILVICAWSVLACFASTSYAGTIATNNKFKYPFYVGLTGGYGWTTWGALIPSVNNQNFAMNMSTPIYVNENGALWGVFAGYEFLPCFALEAAYMHYPNAKVTFDSTSFFSFDHDGLSEFITRTETVSLMGKIMLVIPRTDIRAYSGIGVAEVHRSDEINDRWIVSPTFGAGLNYNFTEHVMGEFGASYTAGRGESELSPTEDYYPFIYSVFLRLAYRF